MKKMRVAGTNTLLWCASQLVKTGEVTPDQYAQILRRNVDIPEEHKQDVIVLS